MIVDYLKKNPEGATTTKIISDLMITDKRPAYQALYQLRARQVIVRNEFDQIWRLHFSQILALQTPTLASPVASLPQFEKLAKLLDMELNELLNKALNLLLQDLRGFVTEGCSFDGCSYGQ